MWSLDTSARSEGTGIQIIGAIVVLAKYRASQQQKAIAEAKARRAFVSLALKPAYDARVKKLKQAAASGRPHSSRGSESAGDAQTKARAELASLSESWKETAASYTHGRYAGDFSVPGIDSASPVAVAFPRLSESQVLAASAAYVPAYLAVSVPAEQNVPGSRDAVMLWDTRTHQLASETVYAVDRTPPTSKRTKIDSLPVQYAAGE